MSWTEQEQQEWNAQVRNGAGDVPEWLIGRPMDPAAVSLEPLPTVAGFPFLHAGKCGLISGPTGRGRSSLVQAGLYDAGCRGLPCIYLGVEVTAEEFDARAAKLADVRGDEVDDELRGELARVRYVSLSSAITKAWDNPDAWVAGAQSYRVIVIDPLASVASSLGLDFDKSNAEFIGFYDRLIQPVVDAGIAVALVDNIGHNQDTSDRAKGVSAKGDKVDLVFSCKATSDGLAIRCRKVRTIRAAFCEGDEWLFERETQRIERRGDDRPNSFRPTGLMERISKLLEANPGGLSKRSIRTAITGRNEWVDLALDLLVSEGFLERGTHAHRAPFREAAQ